MGNVFKQIFFSKNPRRLKETSNRRASMWNNSGKWMQDVGSGDQEFGANTLLSFSTDQTLTPSETFRVRKKVLGTKADDILAETYGETHSLSDDSVGRIANFLSGLSQIGVRHSLVELALYQAKFQPTSGSTAFSILGNSDLTITGSPVRAKHGFKFNNDDPASPTEAQRFNGDLVETTGEWTFLTHTARQIYDSSSAQRRALNALTVSPYSAYIQMQNGTNWQTYSYADSAAASINGGKVYNSPNYLPMIAKNAATAASDSFARRTLEGAWSSTTGRGAVPLDKLVIGAGTANNSTFNWYYDGLMSYWMIWNELLPDNAITELRYLMEETVTPKYRLVFEGDSIAADSVGWSYHVRNTLDFLGGNLDIEVVATGGEATPEMVADIGTANGINDSLSSDDFPVICVIQGGTNDPGSDPEPADQWTAGADETLANLRELWEAARTRGMKVVACTVPKATFMDEGGAAEYWNKGTTGQTSYEVIDELNAAIRADSERYDYLVDVDQVLINEFGILYWQDTDCFSDGTHPGTSDSGAGVFVLAELASILNTEIV